MATDALPPEMDRQHRCVLELASGGRCISASAQQAARSNPAGTAQSAPVGEGLNET